MQRQSGFGLSPHVTASSHLPFLSWFSCSSHPGYRGLARPGAATMFWFKCSLKKQSSSQSFAIELRTLEMQASYRVFPPKFHLRRQGFACGALLRPLQPRTCSRPPGSVRWLEAVRRTAAMAVCTAIPVPQGCSGRCRDRRDRPQRLRRKRSGRNCQFRHGLTATQKGKSAQIAHAVGGSSTGVQTS